jgi:4-amino-4-deoxy-L-arabinose transferase-like glycosyltransferase
VKLLRKHPKLIAAALIFLFAFGFRLMGIRETGGTWDEDVYYTAGYHYYYNIKNGDFSKESWGWNFEHPPVSKYIYSIGSAVSLKLPEDPAFRPGVNYLPLRVESAIMGSLTCVLVFLIGLVVFESLWVGIFAGVILALLPQFVAYGKLVSLESTQCLFLTAVLYFFLKILVSERRGSVKGFSIRRWAPVVLATALAFGTRYSSALVFGWMGLVLLLKAVQFKKIRDFARAFFIPLLLLAVSCLLLAFGWPWLWSDPAGSFIKSFTFSGQHFVPGELQPFYFFKYFLSMTPIAILALAAFGSVRMLKKHRFKVIALVLWIVVFMSQGLIGLKGGGVRYALMVYPAVAVLAGLGLDLIVSKLKGLNFGVGNWSWNLVLGVMIGVYLIANSATVYPYLMDYYGEGVGLVWGAHKLGLHLGFRGEGIKRTTDWIDDNVEEGARVVFIAQPDEAPRLRADIIRDADQSDDCDYIVALPTYLFRGGEDTWEVVYEEKVGGVATLAVVYKRRN